MDSFNTALNCGTFLLPWNAVMLALGILVAVVVSEWIIKKRGMYKDLALDACIIGIPCGIVGGRLFAAISGKIAFSSIVDLSQTGMNLPGALLFAAVGVLIYTRIKKLDRGEVFDALLPGAFFGLAVGRWSDFFLCDGLGPVVGDGVPKFFPLTTFTHAYFADHDTVAYAVFFLDFLVCLALGAAALLMLKKKLQAGKAARVTMLLYIVAEFILEWLRDGEARQIVFGEIRFNQLVLIGMLFVLIGVTLFAKSARKAPEPEPVPETPEPEPEPEAPELEPEATEPEQPEQEPEAPEPSEPEPKAEEASEPEA